MKRKPVAHDLKIVSPHFGYVRDGLKDFEIRFDDRDYNIGDTLILTEHHYGGNGKLVSTKRTIKKKIKYILRKFKGLQGGYIVLGLEN